MEPQLQSARDIFRFNPVVLATNQDRLAKLDEEAQAIYARIMDRRAGDEPMSQSARDNLLIEQSKFAVLNSERTRLDTSIRSMLEQAEVVKGEREESVFARMLRAHADPKKLQEVLANDPEVAALATGEVNSKLGTEYMIQAAGTRSDQDATGGHVAPESTVHRIIDRMKAYGGVEQVAGSFNTGDGNEIKFPQHDTTGQEGEILGDQLAQVSDEDLPAFAIISFFAKTMSSKRILIAREFLQDAFFNVEEFVVRRMVRRLARISNKSFTFGTGAGGGTSGVNEFYGLIPTATAGVTAAATNTITIDELINLVWGVEPSYLMGSEMGEGALMPEDGRIGFLVSYDFKKLLLSMKDSEGRPLLVPSYTMGEPERLLGYPVWCNWDMEKVTNGKVPVLFGNFGYYLIRNVLAFQSFMFFDSATARTNSVLFQAFMRRYARVMGVEQGGKCEAYHKLTMKA